MMELIKLISIVFSLVNCWKIENLFEESKKANFKMVINYLIEIELVRELLYCQIKLRLNFAKQEINSMVKLAN
jgi:hypothetical protein